MSQRDNNRTSVGPIAPLNKIIHDFYEKIGRFRLLAPNLDISSEAKDNI